MIPLLQIVDFINHSLRVEQYPDDLNGLYQGDARTHVRRIGLALEPFTGMDAWVRTQELDALWLHRPWRLAQRAALPDFPVMANHLSFDERLTIGYNPLLAQRIGLRQPEVFGEKAGRPLGMAGLVEAQPLTAWRLQLAREFGGEEGFWGDDQKRVKKIAFVGALSEPLLQEASRQQIDLYVTGQLRKSAEAAAANLQIPVLALGHQRSEVWGLRALAEYLRNRFSELVVIVWLPDSTADSRSAGPGA